MNLQGEFEGQTLSTILQMLCDEEQTGILQVTNNSDESRVFLQDGTIIYAISSNKASKLGAILLSAGVISKEQLQTCLTIAKEKKEILGKVITDKGYLSVEDLKDFCHKQVEDILYNLLFWKSGRFQYKKGKLKTGNIVTCNLLPMKVIMEAARRIDEMSLIQETIPNENVVLQHSSRLPTSADEIKLTPAEWQLISLIDGEKNVKQLTDESHFPLFEVYKILFSATMSGIVDIKDLGAESAPAEIPTPAKESSDDQGHGADEVGIDENMAIFLEEVKNALTVAVGPVATVIMKDQFKRWVDQGAPLISRSPELFKLLAEEIDDEQLNADFDRDSFQLYKKFTQDNNGGEEGLQVNEMPRDPDVVIKQMQDALFHVIGPYAEIIMKESIKSVGGPGPLSKEQLCHLATILINEINDDELADEFNKRLPYCS